ncbi:hypothetical protein BD309DRAFT_962472 [Dichomitus squalens]|uniref:Uncharacterized protein n=2 Tax=Dichomitus squalens TaxID=114155 RepID=A0A4Q9MCB3_9APHY|nr:uncharacterized protein DICSQDRAFT_173314 [Dichomitus squalens LYAD-421 SS1]EJF58083.1 hypothetical protein DICSQDRAFT_173314 [Dichomitus squalens LYAD-421 SS1]TBU24157.1 hypothetical protein BD311DRAFT_810202 [Dichomitus squalens]TBU42640.1 hypothetical protein BD309DRAFT_962472 [Dichomitus squalens]TBU56780.1 hypothetical protein BD310DRAFT_930753 [Dichomitus squalens]
MMLIVATWATLHKRVELRDVYKGTLAAVLLRDGTIYFIGLLILNLLFLIFTYTSVDIMYGMNSSDFVVFIQALTSILLHRFLLHLQSANRRSLMYDSETTPGNNVRFTSIQFGDAEASQGSTLASEYELRNVKPGLGNASEGISEVLRVEETRR